VVLEVRDDGVGFTPYKLSQIRAMLSGAADGVSMKGGGFGLENVNKRIKLYYGSQYGLAIESHYRGGTQVSVTIPEIYDPV
jgi:two-component system sensor histidine kinase YesM